MKNENITPLNFRTMNISIFSVIELIKNDSLVLEYFIPKDSVVWGNTTKSHYIESILIRAPLVSCILHDGKHDFTVIDGMQRLMAINDFFNNEFQLDELKFLHELNGNKFSDLHRSLQRRIEETYIVLDVIDSIRNPELAHRVAISYL